MRVRSLGGEDPLEKEIATHSSITLRECHGQRSLVGYTVQRVAKSQTWVSEHTHRKKLGGRNTHPSPHLCTRLLSPPSLKKKEASWEETAGSEIAVRISRRLSTRQDAEMKSVTPPCEWQCFFLYRSFFWSWHIASRILVPPPGVQPMPPAKDTPSPNQWPPGKCPLSSSTAVFLSAPVWSCSPTPSWILSETYSQGSVWFLLTPE